jgi:hypothetical protein
VLDLLLFAGPTDPDVAAWSAKAGGASGTFKARLSAYVRALKSAGVFQVMGRHYIRGAETAQQALTCLVTRTTCTAQNLNLATAFRPFRGIVGDQVAAYIDWNVTPAAMPHATQNGVHLAQWLDFQDTGANAYLGSQDGVGLTFGILPVVDGSFNVRLNTNAAVSSSPSANGPGLYLADRISASQVVVARNGVDFASLSSTVDTALCASNIFELAENASGTARFWNASRIFASSAGGTLGTSGRAAYAAALNALAKSIGQGGF